MSFFIILIINEVGVITIKKTMPITTGDTKFPSKIPNLNHILFNGDNKLEFNKPNTKKTKERISDQIRMFPSLYKGNSDIIKKTKKKTKPKLLFEDILILFLFSIVNFN